MYANENMIVITSDAYIWVDIILNTNVNVASVSCALDVHGRVDNRVNVKPGRTRDTVTDVDSAVG